MIWTPTDTRRPDEGQIVDWISPAGMQINGGKYMGGGWFFPVDHSMYAYYRPAYWRPSEASV